LHIEGAEIVRSLDEALARAGDAPLVHVIGGASIYALAMPIADELQLTEIDAVFAADTFFPPWDRSRFALAAHEPHTREDGLRYAFATYKRLS
jgi:dihydrofolate reductase